MKKITILFLLCGALFFIPTGCQQKLEKETASVSVTSEEAEPSPASATSEETQTPPVTATSKEAEPSSPYAAENKKYNLALPKAETFGKELKDFIYWEYATEIEKDVNGLMSVLTILEDKDCLNKKLKLHLYYYECDISDMDDGIRNFYNVVVTFPGEKQMSYFSFFYMSKGLSSRYDYEYGGWFDEDVEDISSQMLEKEEWFQKQYTFFGETSLTCSKEEAGNYEVTNHFAEGEKEQILSRIEEIIKETYKEDKNTVVCVRDFLPGDTQLSGRVIDLNMTSDNTMPLYWIQSEISYSDKKMKHFDDVYWYTRYSTGYSGASQPDYNPTVEQLKQWAKEEKESVNIDKCILAYQIKDGKMTDLKK